MSSIQPALHSRCLPVHGVACGLALALVAALSGVPATAHAQAAPGPQGGAAGGCPKGWKPVADGLNPQVRCTPGSIALAGTDPLQGDPGTGDPGQGRDAAARRLASDLVLVGAFKIGGVAAAWDDGASVPASSAISRANGTCKFAFAYATANQGGVATAATSNGIRRDTPNGTVLATTPLPALAGGASAMSAGQVSLKPGTWTLHVHADAPGTVAEYSEPNNRAAVQVTVTGSCAG